MNTDLYEAVKWWTMLVSCQGNNAKLDMLGHANSLLKDACYFAYNPYMRYHVKQIPDYKHDPESIEFDYWAGFRSTLLRLEKRELTGKAAINAVTFVLSQCPIEVAAFLECVLGKDLKMGVQAKSINKVWPNWIPQFDVALAQKVEDIETLNYPVIVQPKLDGVRCIAICDIDYNVTLYSRRGKVFENFPHIEKRLSKYRDMVFDGEIMDGEFQNLMTQVHSKGKIDTSSAVYNVFDFMTANEWEDKKCSTPYTKRAKILGVNFKSGECVESVELETVHTSGQLRDIHSTYLSRGYEGTMIKDPNAPYNFKRSKALLKYKPVHTIDLEVIDMIEGTGKHEGTLGALVCKYHNDTVNVGSGFDDSERSAIWNLKEDFNGKIIEVQYQDATTNKHGQSSLRFPVYLGTRQDKVEADA